MNFHSIMAFLRFSTFFILLSNLTDFLLKSIAIFTTVNPTIMNRSFLVFCILIKGMVSFAQNSVGIGTQSPHASAILDVSSTTKGFLAPRTTTVQRSAIASPAKGLLVYDTDLNSLYHYNGSAWAAVGGGGGFTLPYAGSIASASPALSITNTGDGKAITGTSSSSFTAAIEGTANGSGGYGVVGNSSSLSGYGIYGTNPTGTAVYGFSVNGGVALRGNSPLGYALLTNGNLRLTGGNTNPEAGAVLTSVDANGNAVWKTNQVAFRAINVENTAIPNNVERKLEYSSTSFNYGNGFLPYAGSTTTASSVFTAPVTGVYSFEAGVAFINNDNIIFSDVRVAIYVNGVSSVLAFMEKDDNTSSFGLSHGSINTILKLNANDKVYVSVFQFNDEAKSVSAKQISNYNWFSGHLVFAD